MLYRTLSIILVIAVIGALGTIAYFIVTPKIGQSFTDFYVLGIENGAEDYPRELKLGEEARVTIGIINHEYETADYQMDVMMNGTRYSGLGPVVLAHEEKFEQEISFTPKIAGDNQKVEFFLYKNGEAEPYIEPLRLWIDVK